MPDQEQATEEEQGSGFTNRELIQRFNLLQNVKPHFTVPKIKLAFNRNMARIQSALEPFHTADEELRGEYSVPTQAPIRDEDGNPVEEIDEAFYEARSEYLDADSEPYDPYLVPERLLDNEPGVMPDGRTGLPDGALGAVLWMFEEV